MLKSFIISFILNLVLIFSIHYYTNQNTNIEIVIDNSIKEEMPFALKTSESCNNINAVADIMFGEGENQTLEGKYALANFLVSEAIKHNRTLCEELSYKMPGGALKYSSMHKNLNKLKQIRIKSYSKIQEQAKLYWESKEYLNYKNMEVFNHYITINLAKNKAPKWFKHYIIDYRIYGDHIFANLDFSTKNNATQVKKYKEILAL